ncbi:S66 family peptidase [Streptomyces candidus]|uniref:Muramoyltetrapeptide carboxypeptidase LdcA involved in peptidoglycan recycling n=1 Tax=Streptomyces candidus TaxID=67283 RepID=A0A7X0LS91_9ACTN|nr:S66 peptidase family protein [Streptomyces candidus]MBB6439005.1 muramoyltetrapeptide carboxypeptidase LdcA involved in peptidoglycan recycling [Streptomyces candidus]GHH44582.1 LD-carboxypeptidase [Streptomyces candidus]
MTPSALPVYPPKPAPGDRLAIVSPSSGLPGVLPLPYELGLDRLRKEYGLEPVEYPATRKMGATPQERADDLHAAFADPTVKAVMASIGGDDQITVLPLLDRELLRANPKPFFGWSDNTNLLLALRNLGMVTYHGASVMCELGRPGALHPLTADSIRAALFTHGPYEIRPADRFRDTDKDWSDPATFTAEPEMRPAGGWTWHGPRKVAEGRTWGGNLETLAQLLMADREIERDPAAYEGDVLFLETSEELPAAEKVFRILRSMGERGLLARFSALLMGRPKTWSFDRPNSPGEKESYAAGQREAVLRALDAYAPQMLAVLDVDLGHTDPQVVIPYGGEVRVDGYEQRITVTY